MSDTDPDIDSRADKQMRAHLERTVQSFGHRYDAIVQELSLVRRVSDCLGMHREIDQVCLAVLGIVTEEIPVQNCSVMLLDDERKTLTLRAVKGSTEATARFLSSSVSISFAMGEGVAGQVAQLGQSIRVDDVSTDPRFKAKAGSRKSQGSLLCLPLISKESVLGTFVLSHSEPDYFTDAHERVLHIIANQAGLVLSHMNTVERLQETEKALARTVQNLEEEARERASQLVQAEKLASIATFVSGVAHELNNPLSIVVGYADILARSNQLPESVMQKILAMQQAGIRASKIVENLLSFTGSRQLIQTKVDLNALIRDVLSLRKDRIRERGIRVETDFDEGELITYGDYHQLHQAFLNLLENAIDAMTRDRFGGTVAIRTRKTDRTLEVMMTDTGPGIPEEIQERIFDPFMTTKPPGSGIGLGISLSYWIIERHDGSLRLDQSYKSGARFVITLPIRTSADIEKESGAHSLLS